MPVVALVANAALMSGCGECGLVLSSQLGASGRSGLPNVQIAKLGSVEGLGQRGWGFLLR